MVIKRLALIIAVFITSACAEEEVSVNSVIMNTSEMEMKVGDTFQLTAEVLPSNATNKRIIWSATSDAVSVRDGLVTAKKETNEVKIKATADNGKYAECKVKVKPKENEDKPVKGVKLNMNSAQVVVGKTITLAARFEPSDATNKKLHWSSDDDDIATVKNGTVTGIKAGKTTITVYSDENEEINDKCEITVVDAKVSVTGVKLDKTSLVMTEGEEETLTVTIEPENADNKNVNWSSTDTKVATVANGKVVAKAEGTADIIVSSAENKDIKATCNITVNAKNIPVTGVKLNKTSLAMTKGDEETLKATVEPEEATDKSVEWRSDHPEIADVDEKTGKVTAKDGGEANIIVKTIDGEFSDTCKVTVSVPVEGVKIELDGTEIENLEKTVGETFTLKAKIEPSNATNQNVTWNSLDATVATVDPKNGKVTAKKAGFTVITVTTEDGDYKAECEITVLKEYGNEDGEKVEDEDGEW